MSSILDQWNEIKVLVESLDLDVVKNAKLFGLTTKIKAVDAIALGVSEVIPLEITSAYSAIANNGQDWLIVEDLVDTGETIKAIRLNLPKAHYATVYAKPSGREQVDTFITEVSQDTWIYFPWDMEMKPAPTISERTQK